MLDFFIRYMSYIIPLSRYRKNFRLKLRTLIYGRHVYKKALKIGKDFACAKGCSCNKKTIIGNNVRLNSNFTVNGNGDLEIGDNTQFGPNVLVLTQNHNYDKGNKIPYDETYIYKKVEIGANVWCGARVTILPGTKIGEGAIIQAGAVVHGEVPALAIIGGNPAKVFKYRDEEHYMMLKKQNEILYNYTN